MMFTVMIPEDDYKPKKKFKAITENEYYAQDKELLRDFRCPVCKEHGLFRGGVYIGCICCMNYFSEKDIIEENIKGD